MKFFRCECHRRGFNTPLSFLFIAGVAFSLRRDSNWFVQTLARWPPGLEFYLWFNGEASYVYNCKWLQTFFSQENVRAVRHSKMQSGLRGLLDVHALKVQRTFSRNRNFTDFSLPGCKIEQSCFLRSKYYSEIYGEFFGSLLPLEPTSMTTVEHRRDKDMVPILVEIELKVNQHNYLTGVYERRYLRTFVRR